MRRALELAGRGWGRVAPNPMVGAVVVREGRVVGEGHHAELGGPHAEVEALEAAGDAARGSTLYVILEPCDHRGRTPPCTEAILAAGVARVVFAAPDPDPVAGGGAERLRRAGIEVRQGVRAVGARRLNAPFFWRRVGPEPTPFISLKLALSLDGRLAAGPGVRSAVTGAEARRWTHRLRAGVDAVLVGRGTAEADDPSLTVREGWEPRRSPVRVVLDTELRLRADSALVRTANRIPVWVASGPEPDPERRTRLEGRGVRVLPVSRDGPAGLDLRRLAIRLAAEGIDSVLVEGGGRVASSFLRSGLPRRLHLFYAPLLFGPEGVPAFPAGPKLARGEWRVVGRRAVGQDTLLELEPAGLAAELGGAGRTSSAAAVGERGD